MANKGVDLTGLLGGIKRRLGDRSPPVWSRGGAPVGSLRPPQAEAFCETTHNICIKIQQTTIYWGKALPRTCFPCPIGIDAPDD